MIESHPACHGYYTASFVSDVPIAVSLIFPRLLRTVTLATVILTRILTATICWCRLQLQAKSMVQFVSSCYPTLSPRTVHASCCLTVKQLRTLGRTSRCVPEHLYKEKEHDHSLYTTCIVHVNTSTCFGYTCVAIIRMDIGL